jgi:type IV pilus assembly protein PilW
MYNLKNTSLLGQVKSLQPMQMHTVASTRLQRGASLLELMVGLVIGLLVVLAATGSLVYTHVSSTTMVDATKLQQKADTAFRMIGFQALQAGAMELTPTVDPNTVVFSTAYTGFDPAATGLPGSIVSVNGDNDTGVNRDILRLSYQNNANVRDCLGQSAANTVVSVDNTFTFDAAKSELSCQGSAAGAQPLIDGVEDFQVTYGVRSVSPTGVMTFQYFTAATITDWTNVQTVSVCLQLRGDTQGNPQPATAPAIVGCLPPATVANDGRLRRVYNRTFSLRNTLL